MLNKLAFHIEIKGRVQGVGFRYHTKQCADKLALTGSVRNLDNGDVEVIVFGPEDNVLQFLSWCHKGPPSSEVKQLSYYEIDFSSVNSFEILR